MQTQPNSAGRGSPAAHGERSADPLDFCMEWNAEDQLTRVLKDSGEVARYRYDPLGRRVEKVAAGKTHRYFHDGVDILKETITEGSATTTHVYVHGPRMDEPLARKDGEGTWTYYHADGLGSIVKMTDTSGAVVASYDYDAWGNLMTGSATPDPYGFTGREWDEAAQLWYYRARYYSARDGRFISEDPIGFRGGVNLYAYAGNAPTSAVDPLGLFAYWCRNGNRVSVTLPLTFTGEAGSDPSYAEQMEYYRREIERRWTGHFGKYDVTLSAPYAQPGEPSNQFVVGSDPFDKGASTDRVGGSTAWTNLGAYGSVYVHESGHFMGIEDRYDPSTGLPWPGWQDNVMADPTKRPWEIDIDTVMASPDNKKRCVCK